MARPKGIAWTADQIKIAELLKQGKSPQETAAITKSGITTVGKVAHAMAKGNYPPGWQVTPSNSENGDKGKSSKGKTDKEINAAYITFKPAVIQCPLTPIMQLAKAAATKEWGWRADMPWENFIDTCLDLYFKACGITLMAYYVQPEEESKATGAT